MAKKKTGQEQIYFVTKKDEFMTCMYVYASIFDTGKTNNNNNYIRHPIVTYHVHKPTDIKKRKIKINEYTKINTILH